MQKTLHFIVAAILIFAAFPTFSQANAGDDQEICDNDTYL